MGILAGLKKKRNNLMLQAVLAKIAERLFRFQQGFPLGSDEREVVFMLSPEKKDVNVYIVALGKNAEIKRKCAQYKASELVNMLGNRLQDEGLDLASMLPETENGSQALNKECDE